MHIEQNTFQNGLISHIEMYFVECLFVNAFLLHNLISMSLLFENDICANFYWFQPLLVPTFIGTNFYWFQLLLVPTFIGSNFY